MLEELRGFGSRTTEQQSSTFSGAHQTSQPGVVTIADVWHLAGLVPGTQPKAPEDLLPAVPRRTTLPPAPLGLEGSLSRLAMDLEASSWVVGKPPRGHLHRRGRVRLAHRRRARARPSRSGHCAGGTELLARIRTREVLLQSREERIKKEMRGLLAHCATFYSLRRFLVMLTACLDERSQCPADPLLQGGRISGEGPLSLLEMDVADSEAKPGVRLAAIKRAGIMTVHREAAGKRKNFRGSSFNVTEP